MLSPTSELDVTGTVRLDQPGAVADAVCHVLHGGFGGLGAGESFLRKAFDDIERAFWGKYPGLLRCDTPYHDLRHSLDTALLVARMADGWQRCAPETQRLSSDDAVVATMLGLFHDIGFIRRSGENHLVGAQLMHQHEQRGVEFVRPYLASSHYADRAEWAELIQATNFAVSFSESTQIWDAPAETTKNIVARLIGSADLISQVADRFYLERCRDFLYREFCAAGADQATTPNGQKVVLYRSGVDLVEKTPAFYENLVRRRLEVDFQGIARVVSAHFGGSDPYRESIDRNLSYLTQLIAEGGVGEGLRRHPIPVMP